MIEPHAESDSEQSFLAFLFDLFSEGPSEQTAHLGFYTRLKIETALKNLSDQDKFIDGCVELADCKDIDLSKTDTSSYPTVSYANIERVSHIAPSALRPLLSDSRLGRICGDFNGLKSLISLIRSVFPEHYIIDECDDRRKSVHRLASYERLYLNTTFSHDSIIRLITRAEHLLQLYDIIPYYLGLLLGQHPRHIDIIKRCVQSFDDMMLLVERLPFVKHKIILSSMGHVKTHAHLVRVLKVLPSEAFKILYSFNGMRSVSCVNDLIQILEMVPNLAPDLFRGTQPYARYRAKVIRLLTSSRFEATVRLIYHYPRVLPVLVMQPELQAHLTLQQLQDRIIPQLQESSESGAVEATEMLAWYYGNSQYEPDLSLSDRYLRLAESQSKHASNSRLASQRVLQRFLTVFSEDSGAHARWLGQESDNHNTSEVADVCNSLSSLEQANINDIRRVIKQHPEKMYGFLKQIHLYDFSFAERVSLKESIINQLNRAVEQQRIAIILQVAQLFMYGISGVIMVDIKRARSVIRSAREVIKNLGWSTRPSGKDCRVTFNSVNESLVYELLKVKRQCDELAQKHNSLCKPSTMRELIKNQPSDETTRQHINPLIRQVEAVSLKVKEMKAQVHPMVNPRVLENLREAKHSAQARLSVAIAALSVDQVFRLSQDPSFRKHCRKAQLANHWLAKLFDWSILPAPYALCGSAYDQVMGEYLLGHYTRWEALDKGQDIQAKNILVYCVQHYFSSRAVLLMTQYYSDTLASGKHDLRLSDEIQGMIGIFLERYSILGYTLSAVLSHELRLSYDWGDVEAKQLRVRSIACWLFLQEVNVCSVSEYIFEHVLYTSHSELMNQISARSGLSIAEFLRGFRCDTSGELALAEEMACSMLSFWKKAKEQKIAQYKDRYNKHISGLEKTDSELVRQRAIFYSECREKAVVLEVEIDQSYLSPSANTHHRINKSSSL